VKTFSRLALTVVLFAAAVGLAAAYSGTYYEGGAIAQPIYAKGGLFVGSPAATETTNRVTRALAACATIDFASQTTTCNTSPITIPGAAVNDPCFVGPPASGGAANSNFSCYVSAANTVQVKHCPAGTASDPASAIYCARIISAQ
jgi:hypothetical protein